MPFATVATGICMSERLKKLTVNRRVKSAYAFMQMMSAAHKPDFEIDVNQFCRAAVAQCYALLSSISNDRRTPSIMRTVYVSWKWQLIRTTKIAV